MCSQTLIGHSLRAALRCSLLFLLALVGFAHWASPAFPDAFGKLTILSEASNGEKVIYGGVQGRGGQAGVAAWDTGSVNSSGKCFLSLP